MYKPHIYDNFPSIEIIFYNIFKIILMSDCVGHIIHITITISFFLPPPPSPHEVTPIIMLIKCVFFFLDLYCLFMERECFAIVF